MKTAVDIAEDFTDDIFQALLQSEVVKEALPGGASGKRRRHVIDAAGFDADGRVTFDGEFDIHYGDGGDRDGQPALRADVEGHLARSAQGGWQVSQLQVTKLESVDAALGPDQLPV